MTEEDKVLLREEGLRTFLHALPEQYEKLPGSAVRDISEAAVVATVAMLELWECWQDS